MDYAIAAYISNVVGSFDQAQAAERRGGRMFQRAGRVPDRAAYSIRSFVSTVPELYLPFARMKYRNEENGNRIVDKSTELVIEGFQRSGNTFAVIAFQQAQSRPVKMAHHLHSLAQVRRATALGRPTLVLVRDPIDTCVSHILRYSAATPRQVLRSWIRFYEGISGLRDGIVVADFREVVDDFGDVTKRVNARFGTRFREFEHTPEHVAQCFKLIDERNRGRYGTVLESHVARPSDDRNELKRQARARFDSSDVKAIRDAAYEVFADVSASTDGNQ